jgi:hypothetical protein
VNSGQWLVLEVHQDAVRWVVDSGKWWAIGDWRLAALIILVHFQDCELITVNSEL